MSSSFDEDDRKNSLYTFYDDEMDFTFITSDDKNLMEVQAIDEKDIEQTRLNTNAESEEF